MITLHLLCGIPGSGKSTWAKKELNKQESAIIVSRDEIRKDLVGNEYDTTEKYFAKEKEVWTKFIDSIDAAIALGIENIYVDATHINRASRRKILNAIRIPKGENIHLNVNYFDLDTSVALVRNSKRVGFARVPDKVIFDMVKNFNRPDYSEFYNLYNFKTVKITRVEG